MSSFDPWKRRRPHQKTLFCRQSVGGNLVLQPAEILNDNLEVIFEWSQENTPQGPLQYNRASLCQVMD